MKEKNNNLRKIRIILLIILEVLAIICIGEYIICDRNTALLCVGVTLNLISAIQISSMRNREKQEE